TSDRHQRAGDARDIDPELPQGAAERPLRDLLGRKVQPGGGCEGGPQVRAAECDLGDVGDGEAHAVDQLAGGRIAARLPAPEERDPDMAVAVDGRTVRMPLTRVDLDERPRLAERTVL